uniref:polynucleotide adenylyltransferase n=1 Tax=Spongospora subterranea TaxID=70186 RepID=A0A0H5R4P7_9EUKA|eukprot:CRZ09118.1 hypothetical protein [Spongospora subterranea]
MTSFRPTIADFLLDDFIPLSSSNDQAVDPKFKDTGVCKNSNKDKKPQAVGSDDFDDEPWRCSKSHLKGLTLTEKIHEELIRFCEFVSPTTHEQEMRDDVVCRFRSLALELFPGADVCVFGSVATRLYLPVSDLDLVVFYDGSDAKLNLRLLADELQKRGTVSFIEQILSAKVPIIKFTDAQTGIKVDVCFNVENGRSACNLINTFQQDMPALRPLTLFLKYFLQFREMNETYSGGIGSFLLQMMIVSHLQLHPFGSSKRLSSPANKNLNLGALLLSFFELYGKVFNYAVVGISVRNGGSYFSKVQKGFADDARSYLLCVENPLEPEIDVGRNSFGIMRVRRSFSWAYDRLTLDFPDETSATLLGRLVTVRGEAFSIRKKPEHNVLKSESLYLLSSEEGCEDDLLRSPSCSGSDTPSQKSNRRQRRKARKDGNVDDILTKRKSVVQSAREDASASSGLTNQPKRIDVARSSLSKKQRQRQR